MKRFRYRLQRVLDVKEIRERQRRQEVARRRRELDSEHEAIARLRDERSRSEHELRRAARALRRGGYTVLEAPGRQGAAQLARGHQGDIALLLTDVVMPEVAGPDVARQVSALRPDIGVLFMTGYTDDSVLPLGTLAATARVLRKPFTSEALLRAVRLAIDARR